MSCEMLPYKIGYVVRVLAEYRTGAEGDGGCAILQTIGTSGDLLVAFGRGRVIARGQYPPSQRRITVAEMRVSLDEPSKSRDGIPVTRAGGRVACSVAENLSRLMIFDRRLRTGQSHGGIMRVG